ncbi:MAG: hypothetical protein WKF44_06725 [Rubrobacteraceae bacterium]
MPPSPARVSRPDDPPEGSVRRATRRLVYGVTLAFVVAALVVSISLVVYTAYLHDLWNGAFALIFAVLSAQIALNWMLWREED